MSKTDTTFEVGKYYKYKSMTRKYLCVGFDTEENKPVLKGSSKSDYFTLFNFKGWEEVPEVIYYDISLYFSKTFGRPISNGGSPYSNLKVGFQDNKLVSAEVIKDD